MKFNKNQPFISRFIYLKSFKKWEIKLFSRDLNKMQEALKKVTLWVIKFYFQTRSSFIAANFTKKAIFETEL